MLERVISLDLIDGRGLRLIVNVTRLGFIGFWPSTKQTSAFCRWDDGLIHPGNSVWSPVKPMIDAARAEFNTTA